MARPAGWIADGLRTSGIGLNAVQTLRGEGALARGAIRLTWRHPPPTLPPGRCLSRGYLRLAESMANKRDEL